MANPTWTALEVQVPGKDVLKKIRNLLETLILYLDVARTFLNIIKTFLKAIGNPIRALVEAIIALIVSLIEALRRSGFYAWYNFPNLREDPGLKRHAGGYPAFVSRWKGSLLDAQDINRPRPIPGFNKGGFLMIVADVQGPAKLIRLVKVLIKFFSSSFVTPQYPPPANVKVLPFGEKGSPILSVAEVFNSDLKGLAIEWSLGASTGTADPSFSGLVNEFSREFIPPKWLIEKTSVYPSDQTSNLQGVGSLYVLRADPTARNPRTQDPVIRKYPVRDEYGQPVVLFEEAEVISASQTTAVYLLTALGTFRYLDQKVTKDKPYWYRIRAFSGSLDWNPQTKKINFDENNVKADPNRRGYYYLEWPSTDANDLVVMGQPSGIISGKIVTLPKFDVIENLRHLFLAAFSLNFQQPIPLVQAEVYDPAQKKNVPQVDASGYPVYLPVFDANGDPLPQYKDQVAIGYGSLSSQAGALASYKSIPILGVLLGSLSAQTLKDLSADAPWTQANVRLQAARLTNTYASLLLEAGGSVIESFRALMQGPLPSGPPSDSRLTTEGWSTIKSANTIEKLVFGLTETKPQLTFPDVDVAKAIQNEFTWEVMGVGQLRTYNLAWSDNNVRRNVLAAVNFIKTLGYQGQPPDWVRVSLLQDIVPWSGQILFDMLAKIQALLDAYQGLLDDIVKFIDLIIRKIDVLERFIRFIIEILNFIEQLSAGFYFLSATGLTNGVADWFNAIDTSVGDKPKSTADGGYTAGLCLAYLAPDVTPIETALDLIF